MTIFETTMKNSFRCTNMPGIVSLIREIAVDISEMGENKHTFAQ